MAVAIAFGSQGSAASSSSVATIAGLAFNSAASDRIMAAALAYEGTTLAVSSVTIGGVTADLRVDLASTISGAHAEIWTALVPTGTTGDVVATFASGDGTVSAATFSVTGAEEVPTDTDEARNNGGVDISITALTIPADGAGLVTWCSNQSSGTTAWTGASEAHDTDFGVTLHSSAIVTAVGTNTITADGPTSNQALVGVAWGPAAGGSPTSLVIPQEPLPPALFVPITAWHSMMPVQSLIFSNTPAAPPAASLIYRPTFFDHMIVR